MKGRKMDEIVTTLGKTGAGLVVVIPLLVQLLKRFPVVVRLQAEEYPIYELASIAVGVGLAWATGLPNPIFSGIVSGLAAGKGYDLIASNKKKKK
jgi:hypothetical protein